MPLCLVIALYPFFSGSISHNQMVLNQTRISLRNPNQLSWSSRHECIMKSQVLRAADVSSTGLVCSLYPVVSSARDLSDTQDTVPKGKEKKGGFEDE